MITLAKEQGDLWDSGKVRTNQTVHIVFGGKALGSRTRAFWKVQVWDKDDHASSWRLPGPVDHGAAGPE
jgi:alpha-L-rhamnosidase